MWPERALDSNCPENDDPAAAERKRFVRVTGIPRSFLKTVETPVGAEGSSGGAMLTADGGFVKAVPDQRQWQKQAAVKPRALTGADVRDQEPLEADLTCPLCKKLVWEAVRTPCCNTAFCEECVQTYLVDHDFECPHCESKVPSLDRLKPDEDLRKRSRNYVDHELQKNKEARATTMRMQMSRRKLKMIKTPVMYVHLFILYTIRVHLSPDHLLPHSPKRVL